MACRWSGRQYVYWPDQAENCGDDLKYLVGDATQSFEPGTWHTVEHRVVMNTPGNADGVMQAWLDGAPVLDEQARVWRNDASFGIDALYFSTFFGGGDPSWAPGAEQRIDFDDLVVADSPISH